MCRMCLYLILALAAGSLVGCADAPATPAAISGPTPAAGARGLTAVAPQPTLAQAPATLPPRTGPQGSATAVPGGPVVGSQTAPDASGPVIPLAQLAQEVTQGVVAKLIILPQSAEIGVQYKSGHQPSFSTTMLGPQGNLAKQLEGYGVTPAQLAQVEIVLNFH